MLIIAGVALLLGLMCLARGLRGRRIGSEPRCAKCGFDLTGLRERGTPVCPECGRLLEEPNGVVTGRRRRRRGAIVLAGLLLVVAAGAGAAATKSVNWVAHMPSRVLAEHARWTGSDTALLELNGRLLAGTMSRASVDATIDAALAAQADVSRRWNGQWGAFVETASLTALLSPDRERRYLDQIVSVANVQSRDATLSGWRVPVQLQLDIRRGGVRGVHVAQVFTGNIKGYEPRTPPHMSGSVTLAPVASLPAGENVGMGLFGGRRPDEPAAPPGAHTLNIEYRWWAFWDGTQPTSYQLTEDKMPALSGRWHNERPLRVAARVEDVVAGPGPDDQSPTVSASELGITMRREAGAIHTTRLGRDGRWERFTGPHPADVTVSLEVDKGTFNPGGIAAFDVFVVTEGQEQWLTLATFAPGAREFVHGTISMAPEVTKVDVVLRPSSNDALLARVAGGRQLARDELVIEGAPVIQGYPVQGRRGQQRVYVGRKRVETP